MSVDPDRRIAPLIRGTDSSQREEFYRLGEIFWQSIFAGSMFDFTPSNGKEL
jgi:hypothetical protein